MSRNAVAFALVFSSLFGLVAIDEIIGFGAVSSSAVAAGPETKTVDASTGLKPGDPIGAFRVTKIAGATEDGVEPGSTLCYRCRYGSSPMVMIFARKTSDELDSLINPLEQALAKHEDEKLRAFVTLTGGELSKLKETAAVIAERTGVKLMPIVVAEDVATGPLDYQLSVGADVTVIIAQDSQVVATDVFSISDIKADKVMKQVAAMLAE